MIQLSTDELGEKANEAILRVREEGERVVVRGEGEDLAVIVSLEDGRLLEEIEDRLDLEAARKALEEPGEDVSWEDLKRELGLA